MSAKRKASKKTAPRRVAKLKVPTTASQSADIQMATEKFNRDLQIRGEAMRVGADGKLALEATHEIVETKTDSGQGQTQFKRRRLKMY